MNEKQCTKCKEVKPLSEFYKHKAGKDGLTSYCKSCIREQVSGADVRRNKIRGVVYSQDYGMR